MVADAIITILHIIRVKDIVSQTVFLVVVSPLFIFFNNETKLMQKITHRKGVKNHPMYRKKIKIPLMCSSLLRLFFMLSQIIYLVNCISEFVCSEFILIIRKNALKPLDNINSGFPQSAFLS